LVVIAGSLEKAGAAVLCSNAAVAMGCGLVTLVIHPEAVNRLEGLGPEVMVECSSDPTSLDWSRFDAAAVGPGFGLDSEQQHRLNTLFQTLPLPAVFDADGLTALGEQPVPSSFTRCITPHPGEAARLLGTCSTEIQKNRWSAIEKLSAIAPCLLKGRYSLIASPGTRVRVNMTGNSALSTAGSGDVLTGMVGALLAQGLNSADSLTSAAYLHGWVAQQSGRSRLSASELVGHLGPALDTVGQSAKPLSAKSVIGP
jgi:NAD(P)H-hydrate epimerase